jgi:HEPN domain-containing protein
MGNEISQQWAERAKYDVESARDMLDAGRYTYVLFCCQQAVEKALKALMIHRTGELPPKIHGLIRLAELANVSLSERQVDFVGELTVDYVRSRYPEGEIELEAETTHDEAEEILRSTEEMVQWLLSMMT